MVHLVRQHPSPAVEVSLVDFGLAVKTRAWESGSWKTTNVSGDARYWTPGAWMNVAFGSKYLEDHRNQGFARQYKERLDHFSMGVLALEVFFALWDGRNCE